MSGQYGIKFTSSFVHLPISLSTLTWPGPVNNNAMKTVKNKRGSSPPGAGPIFMRCTLTKAKVMSIINGMQTQRVKRPRINNALQKTSAKITIASVVADPICSGFTNLSDIWPKWFSFIKPWFTNIKLPPPIRKISVAKLNAASEYRVEAIFIRMNFEMQCYELVLGLLATEIGCK